MKKILAAVNKAKEDTAVYLTAELRKNALEHGWHPNVVANLSVSHENDQYKVYVHPDYSDKAFVHEYGDENNRPTAVLRKFAESNGQVKAFNALYKKHREAM